MARHFDKQRWQEEKEQKLAAAKTALNDGIEKLQTDEDWKEMLRSMAVLGRFSVARYSFANQIAIHHKRPGTRFVATYKRWQSIERQVIKGEHALSVLRPVFPRKRDDEQPQADVEQPRRPVGFRTLAVFALDQTEGADLPQVSVPDFTAPEAFRNSVEKLTDIALSLPDAPVSEIVLRRRDDADRPGVAGWYERLTKRIVVLTDVDRSHQFATLVHEVAHAILHGAGPHHSRSRCEVEAESVAFVVCHALGLDTSRASIPYVASWAGQGEAAIAAVAESGQRITSAATRILDALVPEAIEEPEADDGLDLAA